MRRLSFVAAVSAAVVLVPVLAFPAAGNAPATMSWTEHGRAVTEAAGSLEIHEGTNLVVQTHVLEPGFRAPWHHHPDSSWVLMMRGELTVWLSCTDRRVWRAGAAYFNPSMEKAVNEGTEPVELVVIYANVPAGHPAGVIPFTPAIPPAGCAL
jgi:quercetin dioxygenase-like cupin family protein